jgi:adenylate cyclase
VSKEEISGRIVLIGSNAAGLSDFRATPLDASLPGVEIHAQVLEHILSGRTLTRPDYALALEQSLVIILGLMLALVLPRIPPAWAAAAGGGAILLLAAGGWLAFRKAGLLLDPGYPTLALGAITAGITLHIYYRAETQRGEIRNAFGRYLAPAVIEELIAHPDKLELGGEIRELTLMFCDVRNFTSISEHLSALELTTFLNELLTPISEVILIHRGTIDKYMGDAVMAFWNAPLDDPEHAQHACAAALDMTARLDALNDRFRQQQADMGRPFREVKIGIGINTGECCVGNFGSTHRFDYSAIGDEVNVTSRLEGLTKLYGVSAVLGERVVQKLDGRIATMELDTVSVKGRERPTRIYTLVGLLNVDVAQLAALQPLQHAFFAAYRARQWDDAERAIARCRAVGIARLETYYEVLSKRIAALRGAALSPDWDGAHMMTEK